MTTPRGNPELVEGQAVPETTVNEQIRGVEMGAEHYPVTDRVTAPPGSPVDGQVYLIIATASGLFAGKETQLARRIGTGWTYRIPVEGTTAYVHDENVEYRFDGSAWGITSATAAQIRAGSVDNVYVTPLGLFAASAPAALTSGATITPDGDNGFNFTLTLAHDATLANPSNFDVGRSGIIEITQDGTGNQTLAYGSDWKFPGGAPVLSTAAGAIDVLAYFVVASGRILATLTKAYSS